MGWRFRKSFKIIPGLKLNLSKSGLSASVGGAPFTLNVGPRGVMGTGSIPGTGISYREHYGSQANTRDSTLAPPLVPSRSAPGAAVEEIHSANAELLSSDSLKELKRLMQMTYEEREDISRQLGAARPVQQCALSRYESWERGFLLKRLFKNTFAKRKAESETESARLAELDEQLRLTTVATQIDISKEQAEPYFRMRDAFADLCECAVIWSIKSRQATDRVHERTSATTRIDLAPVSFSLGSCDLIQWEQKVPRLSNADGGELFLYPGFVLYRAAQSAFSVLDYHDVNVVSDLAQVEEPEGVPRDATTFGWTWAKANKDGSPDRRFANNHQIPIAAYEHLTLKTNSGLWEEFYFSNVKRAAVFVGVLRTAIHAVPLV